MTGYAWNSGEPLSSKHKNQHNALGDPTKRFIHYQRERTAGMLTGIKRLSGASFVDGGDINTANSYYIVKWDEASDMVRYTDGGAWITTVDKPSSWWGAPVPAGCAFQLTHGVYYWSMYVQLLAPQSAGETFWTYIDWVVPPTETTPGNFNNPITPSFATQFTKIEYGILGNGAGFGNSGLWIAGTNEGSDANFAVPVIVTIAGTSLGAVKAVEISIAQIAG